MARFRVHGNTTSEGGYVNKTTPQTNTNNAQNVANSIGGNNKEHRWEITIDNKKVYFTTFSKVLYMGEREAQTTATFLGFPLRNLIDVHWDVDYEVCTDVTLSIDVSGPDGQGYGTGGDAHFMSLPLGKHFLSPTIDLKPNQHFIARKLVDIEGIGKRYLYGHLYWDNLNSQPYCKLYKPAKQIREIFREAGKPL